MNSPSSDRTSSTTPSATCSRTLRISTPQRTGAGSCATDPPAIEPSIIAPMSETVAHRGQPMTSEPSKKRSERRAHPRAAGLDTTLSLK